MTWEVIAYALRAAAGVSAVHLMDAACELQALLKHRTALGLGPLLHAQPYFSAESRPEDRSPGLEYTSSLVPSTPVLQVMNFKNSTCGSIATASMMSAAAENSWDVDIVDHLPEGYPVGFYSCWARGLGFQAAILWVLLGTFVIERSCQQIRLSSVAGTAHAGLSDSMRSACCDRSAAWRAVR